MRRGTRASQLGPPPPQTLKSRVVEKRLEGIRKLSRDHWRAHVALHTGNLTVFILPESQAKHGKHSVVRDRHNFLVGGDPGHRFSDKALGPWKGALLSITRLRNNQDPIPGLQPPSLSVFVLFCPLLSRGVR